MIIAKIDNYNLNDIIAGINTFLARAAESLEVRALALTITEHAIDPIAAIYGWVQTNVKYVPDPTHIELFISPIRFARDFNAGLPMGGDCDDMAILTTALLRAIGLKSNVVLIDQTGFGIDHAHSRVYSDKFYKYINVDPSSDYPLGWEPQFKSQVIIE